MNLTVKGQVGEFPILKRAFNTPLIKLIGLGLVSLEAFKYPVSFFITSQPNIPMQAGFPDVNKCIPIESE